MNSLKPHFIIIGAMKSGTTTLYSDLALHPEISLPTEKEPHILHRAKNKCQVVKMYSQHFRSCAPGKLLGEASTRYTMVPEYPCPASFARETLGTNLKLIYLTRDPLERIVSHLVHDYMTGRILSTDFNRLVREEARYIQTSNYPLQARPWIKAFGKEQFLTISLGDLKDNRLETIKRTAAFLGVDPNLARVGGSAENARENLRAVTQGALRSFLSSSLYRQRIRPMLPSPLREVSRQAFTKQRDLPEVALTAETKEWVIAQLERTGSAHEIN